MESVFVGVLMTQMYPSVLPWLWMAFGLIGVGLSHTIPSGMPRQRNQAPRPAWTFITVFATILVATATWLLRNQPSSVSLLAYSMAWFALTALIVKYSQRTYMCLLATAGCALVAISAVRSPGVPSFLGQLVGWITVIGVLTLGTSPTDVGHDPPTEEVSVCTPLMVSRVRI